eukprot:366410-Chlamydomonas_euryale.AAC.34
MHALSAGTLHSRMHACATVACGLTSHRDSEATGGSASAGTHGSGGGAASRAGNADTGSPDGSATSASNGRPVALSRSSRATSDVHHGSHGATRCDSAPHAAADANARSSCGGTSASSIDSPASSASTSTLPPGAAPAAESACACIRRGTAPANVVGGEQGGRRAGSAGGEAQMWLLLKVRPAGVD